MIEIKYLIRFSAILLLLVCGFHSGAQTTGAGYVSTIESKARQIENIKDEIRRQRQDILKLQDGQAADIQAAKDRLARAMETIKNDRSWKNRLETARNGWEEHSPGTCSAGGPPPICSANHWFRTSYEEAMKKYNEYKDAYLKPYRDAIGNAGDAKRKQMDETRTQIDKKENQIPAILEEIIALSRKYEVHIKEKAAERADGYASELVRLVSEAHYQESLITRYETLILENNRTEVQKRSEASLKAANEIQALIDKLKTDLTVLERNHQQKVETANQSIQDIRTIIASIQSKIREADQQLDSYKGTESGRAALETKLSDLRSSMSNELAKISELEKYISRITAAFTREKDMISQRIFDARTDINKLKMEAENIVAEAFKQKRELLNSSKLNVMNQYDARISSYKKKLNGFDGDFKIWTAKVESERRRIMTACQSVSASCYGMNVVGEANLAWNKAKDCVADIHRVKGSDAVIYGCVNLKNQYATLTSTYNDPAANAKKDLQSQAQKTRLDNMFNQ